VRTRKKEFELKKRHFARITHFPALRGISRLGLSFFQVSLIKRKRIAKAAASLTAERGLYRS
jgi:hypothetical protein